MTKEERETREYKSLYSDERYAKKAWKELMNVALQGDAKPLPATYDPKTGEQTFQSQLDQMAYDNVKRRLKDQGLDREPQQAEVIVESNILRARFNDTTFNILLDRTAGKVRDELSVQTNPFEDLSDDELEALAAYRASKEKSEESNNK